MGALTRNEQVIGSIPIRGSSEPHVRRLQAAPKQPSSPRKAPSIPRAARGRCCRRVSGVASVRPGVKSRDAREAPEPLEVRDAVPTPPFFIRHGVVLSSISRRCNDRRLVRLRVWLNEQDALAGDLTAQERIEGDSPHLLVRYFAQMVVDRGEQGATTMDNWRYHAGAQGAGGCRHVDRSAKRSGENHFPQAGAGSLCWVHGSVVLNPTEDRSRCVP